MTKRVGVLILFSVLPVVLAFQGTASAQETMSATQDPSQHQVFGQWRVGNPKYSGILVRAKCSYDVQIDGKWSSWWDFQLKSTYPAAMDYVFNYEYGVPESQVNQFGAPSMITAAKSGDMYFNGTELWGTCGQHPRPTKGLHITVACAVPTGKDAPCFKDSNGNRIAQAPASGSQTEPQNTSETFGPAPIKPGQVAAYWMCQNRVGDPEYYVLTDVFLGTYSLTDGVANSATLADFTQQFEKWVRRRYPKAQAAGAISTQCTFMGTTQTEAYRLKQQNLDQLRDWLKKDVPLVVWSPK